MEDLPKIKKRVNAFLVGEEGKISKKNVIKLGVVLGSVAASGLFAKNVHAGHSNWTHGNELSVSYSHPEGTGDHQHHANHSSY